MLETLHTISGSEIRNTYLKEIELHAHNSGNSVIVHHLGEFSHGLINGLAETVEELMISNGDSKKTIKRVFSILIEGLQNIRAHAEKDENGNQMAYLVIARTKDTYKIVMGNLILEKDKELISKYIGKINNMSMSDLKFLYLDILNNDFFTRKGGAGLGFLTMRLESENELIHSFSPVSDRRCFFKVEVQISRYW